MTGWRSCAIPRRSLAVAAVAPQIDADRTRPRGLATTLLRCAFAVVAVLAFVCGAGTKVASARTMTIPMPHGAREAILVTAPQPGPHPTLIVLHGARISATQLAHGSGFAEAAAVHGFTAVFPEGRQQLWNFGHDSGTGADDVGFLNALAQRLIEAKIADPARLYLAGISNGGMMVFTMMCRKDAPFAGFATIVAAPSTELENACTPRKPLKIVMMNGTADPVVPFAGGRLGFFGRRSSVIGIERAAKFLAGSEGCTGKTQTLLSKSDKAERTHVALVAWTGCLPEASVRLYKIEGGGHQIPGGPTFLPFIFGRPNHDIKAADEILKIFAGH